MNEIQGKGGWEQHGWGSGVRRDAPTSPREPSLPLSLPSLASCDHPLALRVSVFPPVQWVPAGWDLKALSGSELNPPRVWEQFLSPSAPVLPAWLGSEDIQALSSSRRLGTALGGLTVPSPTPAA